MGWALPLRGEATGSSLPFGQTPGSKLPSLGEAAEDKELARTIRFELRPVEGATAYEVEINSRHHRWPNPYYFRVIEPRLRVRLSPGLYSARTRSYSEARLFGPWSRGFNFSVVYRPPRDVAPAHGARIQPFSEGEERVVFEWPVVRTAFAYLFEVKNSQGEILDQRLLRNNFATVNLPIHASYSWAVTPLLYLGAEEDPFLEKVFYDFEILGPAKNLRPVSIKIGERLGVHRYEFEVVRFISADETSDPMTYVTPIPEFNSRLAPGEYQMRVRSVFLDNTKSHWSPPSRFYVALDRPKIVGPQPRRGRPLTPNHHLESKTDFEWTPVEGAARYVLSIFNEQGQVVGTHSTQDTRLSVGLPPGQTYRFDVRAYSHTEPERQPAALQEDLSQAGTVRIRQYHLAQLSAAEEPSDFYIQASHWFSNLDYESLSYDDNSYTTNSIWGGTGELALGYWHRQTRVGLLGFANLSGFNIRSENYLYGAYGLQLGYRQLLDARSRLRLWAGWGFKELPQLITRPGTDFLDVQNIKTNGIYIQGAYLRDFNRTYGWSISGNYYHSMGQNSTPNGLPLESLESLQLGIYATKAMGTHNRYRGRMGYTYKLETLSYPTIDPIGINNQVRIEGHYLSFILEMGLRDLPENVYGR